MKTLDVIEQIKKERKRHVATTNKLLGMINSYHGDFMILPPCFIAHDDVRLTIFGKDTKRIMEVIVENDNIMPVDDMIDTNSDKFKEIKEAVINFLNQNME